MKQWNFKMKKLCSAKHFKPWLMNSTDQQSETSQKKAICIIYTVSYSIVSTNIDTDYVIVKIFCISHNKVALLTQEMFWAGKKKLSPNNF